MNAPAPTLPELPEEIAVCIPPSGPLFDYMRWAIKTTDAEPVFHLGSLLSCWSHACVSRGWKVNQRRPTRPAIWSFIVGVPASSKSTAMSRATDLYKDFCGMTGSRDPIIFAEGSVPGIFEALCDHWDPEAQLSHGIFYRDEAARLLDTKDSVADMLCNIIDGVEVKRHLRGAREANRNAAGSVNDALRSPGFSGMLTTTFSRLRDVTQASHLEGGLFSRFTWFVGQSSLPLQQLVVDMHGDERAEVLRSWEAWNQWTLGMSALGEPLLVQMPDEAYELLRVTLFASLVEHGKHDNRLNAARKRALNQAIDIAGLFAISQQRTTITDDDMDRAINLVLGSLQGLERLEPTLATDAVTTYAERVFQALIDATEGMQKATLLELTRCDYKTMGIVLQALLEEGAIEKQVRPTGKPGRPPEFYVAKLKSRFRRGTPRDPSDLN